MADLNSTGDTASNFAQGPSNFAQGPSATQLSKRITELEIQLAHQQRLCEQLNAVVVEHTQQILRLERHSFRLEEQIKAVRELRKEAFDPGQERPPHY